MHLAVFPLLYEMPSDIKVEGGEVYDYAIESVVSWYAYLSLHLDAADLNVHKNAPVRSCKIHIWWLLQHPSQKLKVSYMPMCAKKNLYLNFELEIL